MTIPEHTAGVAPGDVLAGKYRVERVLGEGGMGVVVAAHHIQLDEKVALKFLLPEALGSAEAIARFDREARAAVKIKSEHVARVIDVGKLESGAPYMVMEYLDGNDLSGWVEEHGAMAVEQAVEFALQACEALAEAHALGIVHRDLKPANLFCLRRADGLLSVKVLDFGISKITPSSVLSPSDRGLTSTRTLVGSPFYMSPEQLQASKNVDSRTDIWALGVILFELVGGRVPFDAEVVTELAIKIATQPPLSLGGLRADLPPGFEAVVMQCLQKDPGARFQSVADLALALADYAPARARGSVERVLRTVEASGGSGRLSSFGTGSRSGFSASGSIALSKTEQLPTAGQKTNGSWGTSSRAGAIRKSRRNLTGAILGAVALVLAGAGLVLKLQSTAATVPVVPAVPAVDPRPVPSAPPIGLADPLPTPPPPASVAPPASAVAPPATTPRGTGPAVVAPHPSIAPPPPASTRAAPPPPTTNCNPPYFIDAAGHRQYKPECL